MKHALMSIQGTAIFLVIFGGIMTGVGCWKGWGELKTLGASIAGAGLQAITTQVRASFTNKEGGTVNMTDSPTDPTPSKQSGIAIGGGISIPR